MKQAFKSIYNKVNTTFSQYPNVVGRMLSLCSGNKLMSVLILIIITAFTSCNDYLNPYEYGLIDQKKAFSLTSTLDGMANSAYSYVPAGFNRIGNSYLTSASDEAEEVNDMEAIQAFNVGSWNKISNPDDVWTNCYKGIRIASDYLQGTDTLSWWEIRYSNPAQYTIWIDNLCRNRGEMHFLRGLYYFELFKRYGDVPLLKEKLDLATVDRTLYGRAPVDSVVNFIVDELDKCTSRGKYALTKAQKDTLIKYNNKSLPSPYRDTVAIYYANPGTWASRQGRATLGSALALKAKVLIYAASPQFNPTGDVEKWKRAAAACKEVLDLTTQYPGYYSLSTSYAGIFSATAWNNEFLYAKAATNNTFEIANFPINISKGSTGTCPTSDLVDDYENKDGTPFSWTAFQTAFNTAKAANKTLPSPFDNRDYRLKMTILTNMDKFNSVTPIECFVGGTAGQPIYHATKTGYYLKKFTNQALDLTLSQTSAHYWPYMRLGDFFLLYAEAMNEAYGPEVKPAGYTLSALDALNKVRRTGRNDVKMPLITTGKSQVDFRKIVKHERRIELAFEDARYWDLRRWKESEIYLNGTIHALKITKNSSVSNDFKYEIVDLENRVFDASKMYFYPIPQTEIDKAAGVLVQNPNW